MRIQTKNNKKKIIYGAIIAPLLICLLTAVLLFNTKQKPALSNPQVEVNEDLNSNQNSSKQKDSTGTVDSSDNQPMTSSPKEEASNAINKSPLPSPSILSATQSDTGIRIAANFTDAASGDCKLTLSKAGEENIIVSAPVIVVPGGYACDGFKIANVSSKGGWTATIVLEKDGASSPSSSRLVQ